MQVKYQVNNRTDRSLNIGIFGHVGKKNLGDEAILAAVIENLPKYFPRSKVYGFTMDPCDTHTRHGLQSFPIRRLARQNPEARSHMESVQDSSVHPVSADDWSAPLKRWIKKNAALYGLFKGIRRIVDGLLAIPAEILFVIDGYKNIKGIDLLIIAGSQQLIDYVGGPWAFPYTLFKWSVLARLAHTKVVFLSVGAGPIYTRLGKFFDRIALSLAKYRSYRDDTSCRCVNQLGLKRDKLVVPDLAFSLAFTRQENHGPGKSAIKVVGINPVPFGDGAYWIGGGASPYRRYIQALGLFGLWLIENGYHVRLFSTQLILDPPVIRDIKQIMEQNAQYSIEDKISQPRVQTLDELLTMISSMDYVVATRYHGVVLSYVVNKPVMGIAYQPKTADLMRSFGQSAYTIDIDELSFEEMRKRFELLEMHTKDACEKIKHQTAEWRNVVKHQYARVFSLLENTHLT
jgi:polysaccharide pyruvyl transferase WcaK-like protein